MSDEQERAELLAALHAAGAASEEDEQELQRLLEADPSLEEVVRDFQDSIAALASPFVISIRIIVLRVVPGCVGLAG